MKLTTKGRYAVTTLLDLASSPQQGPINIGQIANRHAISVAYLERLAGRLREQGLLKSVRGAQGGYILARPADQITVADIMLAVDEKLDTTQCHGKSNCHEGGVCATHHLWDALNHKILGFLRGITLQDLITKPNHQPIHIHFAKNDQPLGSIA